MSHEEDKYKHSRRLLRDQAAIDKQQRIVKAYGFQMKAPARAGAKRHLMNCGNPKCVMCGNPRRVFKEKTFQEQKMEQDLEE